MALIMVICVDMFYVEGNGTRQNICGANADANQTTTRINHALILPVPNMIEELRTDSELILEVIFFLDRIIMVLIK